MKAYSIVMRGNEISESGFEVLNKSSIDVGNGFTLDRFDAIIASNVEEYMDVEHVEWNYPNEGQVSDFQTGLTKTAYQTANINKRMACAMSHLLLWKQSRDEDENILVLEHDAKFVEKLDFDIENSIFGIIGINNPFFSTRRAAIFHDRVQANLTARQSPPYVDNDKKIPQGLAGNSAYIITPWAADKLLRKVDKVGLWPNDALMCQQLFPFLGVTRKYYTEVQKLPSTTTL